MEIAIQSSDELEQLRTRLRKMSDDELIRGNRRVHRAWSARFVQRLVQRALRSWPIVQI
jgi:hypothetical protein